MLGTNKLRPPVKEYSGSFDIQEIFTTIQGEGPLAGTPAVFVRLGGCNLACVFCDTEFESFTKMPIERILENIKQHAKDKIKLVVITGGEPLRQHIEYLCEGLIESGFSVQIETNGTIYRELPKEVQIVCSPKAGVNGYSHIRQDLLERISAFKFLISTNIPGYDTVPELGQSTYNIPVYLQPMDEYNEQRNKQNHDLTLSLSMHHNYKFSIQLHKVLEIA